MYPEKKITKQKQYFDGKVFCPFFSEAAATSPEPSREKLLPVFSIQPEQEVPLLGHVQGGLPFWSLRSQALSERRDSWGRSVFVWKAGEVHWDSNLFQQHQEFPDGLPHKHYSVKCCLTSVLKCRLVSSQWDAQVRFVQFLRHLILIFSGQLYASLPTIWDQKSRAS